MNILSLAAKDLILTVRDRKGLLTLIIMPMVLIAILGSAFSGLMDTGGEAGKIENFSLAVANQDEGPLGAALTDQVFGESMKNLIQLKKTDEAGLQRQLENREAEIGVLIPPSFSSSIFAGKPAKIVIKSTPDAGVKTTLVEGVLQQFVQTALLQTEAIKLAAAHAPSADPQALARQMQEQASSTASPAFPLLEEQGAGGGAKPIGSFQYYAVAMGVMFLLMTVVNGVSAMIEEKEEAVFSRLLITNLTHSQYIIGKFLGLLAVSLLQFAVIVLGTSLLYGVDWGSSAAGIVFISFAYVFSACGLGVFFGSLIKSLKAFEIAGMLGTQIMAAIGGSMVPVYLFPDSLNQIAKALPNALALQTFLDLMSGAGMNKVLVPGMALLGLGLLFMLIGWLRLAAQRRIKYA